jgi:SAM-dependent methyltransferase
MKTIKVPFTLLRLAYRLIDVESTGCTAAPDGRIIEYSFVIGRLAALENRGRVLDVGCASRLNYLPAAVCSLGWEVWGIDARQWAFRFPGFHFVRGDVRTTSFPEDFFDAIYNVSAIEHIGVAGRYGVREEDPEGDLKTVREIRRILKRNGVFLTTMPYGKDARVERPMGRIYGRQSLQRLISGWKIEQKTIFVQDAHGFWVPTTDETIAHLEDDKEALAVLELRNCK